ncbi:hypothetical protein BDF14DRAFT_1768510 [Spinellus fusiger]|nr:hypothetical protein BDF14DRAFT_1768510 [Spinellus fusiger]
MVMPLNRQRPQGHVNSRASTMPSFLCNKAATATVNERPLYRREDSLEEWLSRNISEPSTSTTLMLENPCCCCGHMECSHLIAFTKAIRKLEGDTRLAAEIGQGLLHKHELFVLESSQIKAFLEQQLDTSCEQIKSLQQQVEETDSSRHDLLERINRTTREYQKTQKLVENTSADLDMANTRCLQLTEELKKKTLEIEKLRVVKFMMRQAETREETLRSKLEDTKQELASTRKNELGLESKHKKLRVKYGTVLLVSVDISTYLYAMYYMLWCR